MIKAKDWPKKNLKGLWHVTVKIDGVRCLWSGKEWLSRADKPLYNLPPFDGRPDCEAYCGEPTMTSSQRFRQTISQIRAKTKARPIRPDQLYRLDVLDPRLDLGTIVDPTVFQVMALMDEQVQKGNEGLVLRKLGDDVMPVWYKVKPIETYDVRVTGIFEGEGKHKGRMGYLATPMGDVGTGFTDEERELFWGAFMNQTEDNVVGTIIEVECMKVTDDGFFRHPRFMRLRPDKK